ncbi:hypothetical protein FisN_19Hu300 [Fistulifera solaris]|uniref:Uncharacterized protein n=1 Tax=Fistulifera solaris TaxID=1519565 RepID=A0A1Z5K083_FISSO|nr:hypothetical protein FisN_19Hu300 [Fistulifera solaris]|eukprot:GAX19713.1 hypothetical protein FisN_19Hu300 [Fistulifera solaris]
MNTTNSLRWRARVTKEAFLHDNDESNVSDRWETSTMASNTSIPNQRRCSRTLCIDTLAMAAVGANVYVLLQWSLLGWSTSSSVMRVLIFTGCGCTLLLASLVIRHERTQQTYGTLRHVYGATRRTVRSLQQQNERLCRSLTALDRTMDRMKILEQELQQFTQSSDTLHSIQSIQEYLQIQKRLKEQLQYQVQEHILTAVLSNTTAMSNNRCQFTASELERLITQLQNMPGVVLVNEASLRDSLVSKETPSEDSTFTVPLEQVLSLLWRVRKDVHQTIKSINGEGIFLDEDHHDSAIFQFQPQFVLPSKKDLMEF